VVAVIDAPAIVVTCPQAALLPVAVHVVKPDVAPPSSKGCPGGHSGGMVITKLLANHLYEEEAVV